MNLRQLPGARRFEEVTNRSVFARAAFMDSRGTVVAAAFRV